MRIGPERKCSVCPGKRVVYHRLTRRELPRIDAKTWPRTQPESNLLVGGLRTTAGKHRGIAFNLRQLSCHRSMRKTPRPPVVFGNRQTNAGARRKQRQVVASFDKTIEVGLAKRINNGNAYVLLAQGRDLLPHSSGATRQDVILDEADLCLGLRLQHAHKVGVGHRRKRMVFHARFR